MEQVRILTVSEKFDGYAPYLAVVGAKESENGSVALRSRKDGELGEMSLDEVIEKLMEEVKMRVL